MAQLQQFTNNATATLASSISAGATTISLQAGQGALFPTLTGSQYFIATLKSLATGQLEIVRVTARATDTLTVSRGQEGTAANAYVTGDVFELRPTAGAFNTMYGEMTNYLQNVTKTTGLTGFNNTTTPNTQYDWTATQAILKNSSGAVVVLNNITTLTTNILTAGPVANGRDQAGAFTAGTFIHFYLIYNGTTVATIASASVTAPTLPSGYTYYCYMASIFFTGGSILQRTRVRGSLVVYDAYQNAVNNSGSTSETPISVSNAVPPASVCSRMNLGFYQTTATNAGGAGQVNVQFKTLTGNVHSEFLNYCPQANWTNIISTRVDNFPNLNQQFIYQQPITLAGAINSISLTIYVSGYTVLNGDN